MRIGPGVELAENVVSDFCRRHQIKELSIFGSAARGELRSDSDIDLLVDFFPEARISLLDLAEMMEEFSDLVGRRVDIAVKPALRPRVRDEVLSEARPLYAA
jgi:uncharacterized protein